VSHAAPPKPPILPIPAAPGVAADADLERTTMRAVTARLIPILFVVYIFNFLDRTNVGLAALQMNRDLGFSSAAFGFGAGVFFVGYALLEVPSNLALVRFGARRWIARIAISWGVLATLLMFVRTPLQFYVVRFLLGAAEAGFFPAIVYYLSLWYPASMRARSSARFIVAIPLSGAIGGPLGGSLLGLDGVGGLHGWQWLFLVEGIPSVLLGVVVLFYLTERPEEASWLRPAQRDWLVARLRQDREKAVAPHGLPPLRALANPTVWLAGLPLFFLNFAGYGYIFWGPTLIRETLHTSNAATGWLIGVVASMSAVALIVASTYADRTTKWPLHAAFWAAVVTVACAGAALLPNPLARLTCLALVQLAGSAFLPSFVAIPTVLLTGPSVAIGVALVNSIGNVAGFAAPSLIGYLRGLPGGDLPAFLSLSVFASFAVIILLKIQRHPVFRATR
jgi:sugar phosphate permease